MPEEFEWSALVSTAARPAYYAYKYRHFIQKQWIDFQVMAGLGKPSVLITGRAGAGKSVLAAKYHGEANSHNWKLPETSADTEIKSISVGDWNKIVHVVPGQESLNRSKALDKALNKQDSLQGIIHVVDWGYTAVRDETIRATMIENGIDSIEKFREKNLDLELDDFKLLIDKIITSNSGGRGPKWLVIAVNKIDLFMENLSAAKKYYHPKSNSAFAEQIGSLYKTLGENNFKVECIPICSVREPFSWGDERLESQMPSDSTYANFMRIFIDTIAATDKRAMK